MLSSFYKIIVHTIMLILSMSFLFSFWMNFGLYTCSINKNIYASSDNTYKRDSLGKTREVR